VCDVNCFVLFVHSALVAWELSARVVFVLQQEMQVGKERIDYIELNVADTGRSKQFYGDAFGWKFTDYGPHYTEFDDGRMKGGFAAGSQVVTGGPLVILYAEHLEKTLEQVTSAGGSIAKPIFEFPGGRRFHFRDPDGHELAVWSDKPNHL